MFFLENQLLNIYITLLAETIGKGPFAFYFVAMAVKYNPKVAEGPFGSFGENLLTKKDSIAEGFRVNRFLMSRNTWYFGWIRSWLKPH